MILTCAVEDQEGYVNTYHDLQCMSIEDRGDGKVTALAELHKKEQEPSLTKRQLCT